MFEIFILIFAGIGIGIVTGMTPGLHVNTIAVIGLSAYPYFSISPLDFAVVMSAMAITHTFLDFIPSIFLGVPEESTALSVLPAHRLFIEGRAMEAVKLTAYGSFFGLFFALLLTVPVLIIIPALYESARGVILWILIPAIIYLIIMEKTRDKISWAFAVFMLSGWFGLAAFNLKILSTMEVLFPVFAGLFGLSNIAYSLYLKTAVVPQDEFADVKPTVNMASYGFVGAVGGAIIGILPAMSPSQIGAIFTAGLGKVSDVNNVRNFLIILSAINTSDALFSILSIYTINNARSGVAEIMSSVVSFDINIVIFIVGVMAFTALFVTYIHIRIGKRMIKIVEKLNYRNLCIISFFMVVVLVFIFTGIVGVGIALLGMCIGLVPIIAGISRTHLMGVLLVPTILYFMGTIGI